MKMQHLHINFSKVDSQEQTKTPSNLDRMFYCNKSISKSLLVMHIDRVLTKPVICGSHKAN